MSWKEAYIEAWHEMKDRRAARMKRAEEQLKGWCDLGVSTNMPSVAHPTTPLDMYTDWQRSLKVRQEAARCMRHEATSAGAGAAAHT